jgi:hypothetical protein
MTTIELGNIGDKEQAIRLVEFLGGKTFYNFIAQYGICAGNYPVSISTERVGTTEDELKDMVLFVLALEI